MEIAPYILNEYQPFQLQLSVGVVREFFNDLPYSHFPVVEEGNLIGLLCKEEVDNSISDDQVVATLHETFAFFCIENFQNVMDIIKVFAANDTNLVPVVNKEMEYLGYFDLTEILSVLNSAPFFNQEGESILIEKDASKYSFSEICQIVESNKGKVLCSFIAAIDESTVKISLKFKAPEINEIIQTFRRYDYTILSDHKDDFYLEDLKSRSEYLQKYLNI